MKRDMELIRLLLLQLETDEPPPELKNYEEPLVVYNSSLAIEAGLIEGSIVSDGAGYPRGTVLIRLTWAGHDFLDATRDKKIWNLAKEKILKPGISWTFSLLVEFLKQEAKQHLFKAAGIPISGAE